MGNRRVYSTKWLNTWVNWERDNATVDSNGSYLTCIRPRDNGIKRRVYLDMSMADIEIDMTTERYLTWDKDTSTDPADTKYLRKHYLNGMSLRDLAHLPTNDFLRHIESLPCRSRQTPGRRGK